MSVPNGLPAIGERVHYRPASGDGTVQPAVVVGYPDGGEVTELHLAVLMTDEERLDLIALAVPYSSDARAGTWSGDTEPDAWPPEHNDAHPADPVPEAVG